MFAKLYTNCLSEILCNQICENNVNVNKTKIAALLNRELSINLKDYLSLVPSLKPDFMEFDDIVFKVILTPCVEYIHDGFTDFYNTRYRVLSFMFCFNSPMGIIEFINGERISLRQGSLLIYPANWCYSYRYNFNKAVVAQGFLYINENKLVCKKVDNLYRNINS